MWIDKRVIPASGPSRFESNGYIYTFKTTRIIENFVVIEQIYKDNKLIYYFIIKKELLIKIWNRRKTLIWKL